MHTHTHGTVPKRIQNGGGADDGRDDGGGGVFESALTNGARARAFACDDDDGSSGF